MQMFVLKIRDLEATYCIPYINGHTLWDTKPDQERNPAFRFSVNPSKIILSAYKFRRTVYQNVQAMIGKMSRERPNNY